MSIQSVRSLVWLTIVLAIAFSQGCGAPPDNGLPDGGNDGAAPAISGTLSLPTNNTARPVARDSAEGYVVVAVSNETEQDYRGTVDTNGSFLIDIPESEAGNTFIVTVLGPDSKPVGPIMVGAADGQGVTGLKPAGEVELGTIELPADTSQAPMLVGDDAGIGVDEVNIDTVARLDGDNVPVGVGSFGKGNGALAEDGFGAGIDSDKDGLVDLFDADDDGDGTVDDFEDDAFSWELPPGSDVRANFFMNLKISVEESSVYYDGTAEEIDAALSTQTVITFECMTEPSSTRSIAGAHLLDSPAPTYLPGATLAGGMGGGLWSASDYAFQAESDRYDAFVVPNDVMQPGDTFTVEIEMDDGSTVTLSRMLNFIFKRIPRLVAYGTDGDMEPFDPDGATENGSQNQPVLFADGEDLVTEYAPPQDEDGNPLTDLDYTLEFFFMDASNNQLNGNIDGAATWPTAVPGTEAGNPNGFSRINISKDDLTLTEDGTYLITIPKEIFVDEVTLNGGGTAAVHHYKLDIAAQCPSGNAAIMWNLAKE